MSRTPRRPRLAAAIATAAVTLSLSALSVGSSQAASVATWDKVAQCESTGNWSINTNNGYYGGLQIAKPTWDAFGGKQYAAYPHQATKVQQILTAEKILAGQGPGAWGGCATYANLGSDHADPYPDAPTSQAGDFYHAIRQVDGSWTSFNAVGGFDGSPFFNGSQEAITSTPDGSAQVLGTGTDGNLYHSARYSNGTWTGWAPLDGYQGAAKFGAKGEAIAGMGNGDAQIMAIGNDGKIYHNARYVNGSWQGWQPVGDWSAQKIAAAALPNGDLQVLIVGNDGNLYHSLRTAGGSWQAWNAVSGVGTAATFQAGSIAIAGLPNGDSQLLAVGNDGKTYHNIRFASGSWQGWGAVEGIASASSVAITGMPNGDTQILATGQGGTTYHNARFASGSWQGWWNTGFGSQKVALAGMGDGAAQMLVTRS
ncbi:transglycosylase family protein [Streptomyces sp. APSN-46.1]|uniref:transglycosylase family protein n=1 Tax=Streptomyces sp. APSN-46.1 TaxID=2929049 RepID=UPI0024372FA8|nr:transglycosylase family protein [Streptomyces sp. APSN-46.1]